MPSLSAYNASIIAFATFGSITYGYCASIISSTLGQPTFVSYFKLGTADNASALEGAMNGLFQAGGLFGTLLSAWVADRYGRCKAIFMYTVITIIGGALQTGSVHIAMFLVARFITGLGIGGLLMLVPLWQSEVSPPGHRGLLVGLHGVSILIGYGLSTWIGYGFFFLKGTEAQWRVPLAIQIAPASILGCGILMIPESPRWLVKNGYVEAANAVLHRIHKDANDPDNTFAQEEFNQIQSQLSYEATLPSSWKSIATVPHYRKRAWIGFLTMFAGQFTGTLVINNYGPTLYSSLGYGSADTLLLSAGWITEGLFANMLNAYLLDRVGRKWLMTTGLAGCVLALVGECIFLALFQGTNNKAGNSVAVFFLYLHLAIYGSCMDASTYVFASEIWPTHLRAKGFALSCSGLFLGSLILLVSAPTAFANVGWKFYLVMVIVSSINIAIFALFLPETKGLPLEEIAARFGDPVTSHFDAQVQVINGEDDLKNLSPSPPAEKASRP
ncbi:sugar transporter family protein [Aspergillus piperis CBS 112811]|uniref:Sugar transporter family protein n=1 Tax=Aspergillus piperis CBS 112811 TaxID=1448313 RepID=A0A8G1QX44_9EURO|nr:sugar transporter family protein [Aspergillus piperis CBS 112811]RAH54477.1 sugar transporter family protein [Aspergillus piperis CBS 112811]